MSRLSLTHLILLSITLLVSFPIFFHKLGQSSLVSFDEAWYAAIAKNIGRTGDLFNLYYNNNPFADHPPAGFWFIRLGQIIFGIDEFGSRASSAIFGLLTLGLVFILGTQVASPIVGIASALALSASPWFIYRARSGNLDVPLTFFFVLSFVLGSKAAKDPRWLIPFAVCLALLFLTKTMVPFTLLPALLVLFFRSKINPRQAIVALIVFFLPVSAWLLSQLTNYPHFISKYLGIGIPKIEKSASLWQNILLTKTYLHESIGNWFRPIVLLSPFSFFSGNRLTLSLIVFAVSFLTPFVLSSRSQIWHLIPVQPFLLILMFSGLFWLLTRIFTKHLSASILLLFTLLTAAPQMTRNWNNFIAIPAYVSDEAILSQMASVHPEPLYIDDRFLPVAVFYSDKIVNDTPTPDFSDYFTKSTDLLLITHRWRLDAADIPSSRYQILGSDRDKILLKIFKN